METEDDQSLLATMDQLIPLLKRMPMDVTSKQLLTAVIEARGRIVEELGQLHTTS